MLEVQIHNFKIMTNKIKELGKGLYRGKLHYQINAESKCKIMHIKIGYLALKKENKL